MSYLDLSIKELHEAYVAGKVTPKEIVLESLERAKADDNNCFEMICEEEALRQVEELGEVEVDNVLWGIPFALKDNFSTKGLETTASSNILVGYKPLFDSTVYKKLREKKAILLGKTTLDELAMGGTGTTGHKGITYNPYDKTKQRMAGGSSCGSASSVAAGIVQFAIGSDTGDSVRKPASYEGLVGTKPTWGRISRYGLFPFAPSLDHVAFFTRDVEDAAYVLEALSGRDYNDSTSSTLPVEKYEEGINNHSPKKIAVIKEIIDSIKNKALLNAFNKSIEKLKEKGHVVEFVDFGLDLLHSIYATYIVISCAEATSNDANLDGIKFGPFYNGNTYQDVMREARTRGFCELIKRRFVIGSFALMRENQDVLFLRAQRNRAKIVERTNQILKDYDFIYVPAAPGIAPEFKNSSDKLSNEYLIADNHLALGNFAGLPSITLPLTFENGMPIGINFMGRAFQEKELLNICKEFEDISGLANLSVLNKKEGNL